MFHPSTLTLLFIVFEAGSIISYYNFNFINSYVEFVKREAVVVAHSLARIFL
jgi:hypothetical protein